MGERAYADMGYGARIVEESDELPTILEDDGKKEAFEKKHGVEVVTQGLRYDNGQALWLFIKESLQSTDWDDALEVDVSALSNKNTRVWNDTLKEAFKELKLPKPERFAWFLIASHG